MLEFMRYANSLACFIIMGYMLIAAIMMPNRGFWLRRVAVVSMTVALWFQIMSPFEGWIPQIVWHGALLHCTIAGCLLDWHREAVIFIRCKFAPPETPIPLMRRASDWVEVADI